MVLIVGWGTTGQAIFKYLNVVLHMPLLVFDEHAVPSQRHGKDVPLRCVGSVSELAQYVGVLSCVYVSPGFSPKHPLFSCLAGIPIKTDIDLFFEHLHQPWQRVIAVTGTNGKSTVCSLVTHMLKTAGIFCVVSGNFGRSVLDDYDPSAQVFVLELSSFQLHWSANLSCEVGVLTNLDEDHTAWHGSVSHYHQSKLKLFKRAGQAICLAAHSHLLASFTSRVDCVDAGVFQIDGSQLMCGGVRLLDLGCTGFIRPCDRLNLLFALRAIEGFDVSVDDVVKAILSYVFLPYRCMDLGCRLGAYWVNDSKSTNAHSTLGCLEFVKRQYSDSKIVLLLGGDLKGQDPCVAERFKGYPLRAIVAFGKNGNDFAPYVCKGIVFDYFHTLAQAFEHVRGLVVLGDCVVFSPACASTDQFRSYLERGRLFDELFKQLPQKSTHIEQGKYV